MDFSLRISKPLNSNQPNPNGDFVLYWMVTNRRADYNFSLDYAIERCRHWNKPLVVLEALRLDYPWACPRFHQFVVEGMLVNRTSFEPHCTYLAYLEPSLGAAKGLLETLGSRAVEIISDEFPCFFIPRMQSKACKRLEVPLTLVDSNGLLPLRAAPKAFERAVDFRRFLQKNLKPYLAQFPSASPFDSYSGGKVTQLPDLARWPMLASQQSAQELVAALPLNGPAPYPGLQGGTVAAKQRLGVFLHDRLGAYENRSHPTADEGVSSGLSPYLHFGHISCHEILERLGEQEGWSYERFTSKASGSKDGTWGMSPNADGFLDELVTWREMGYGYSFYRPDYTEYDSLPGWALKTLEEHAKDKREWLYSLDQLDQGQTHDPIWNAAQRQLRESGVMQNYLRMLWGKKVLEWTEHPRQAVEFLVELNNRYALDGRNPNSYSGIFWCLGRFDRPWFERAIFGSIRYMSSDSTSKKFKLAAYMKRWGSPTKEFGQSELF